MHPIELFEKWQEEELALTDLALPAACCFSTIGLDGFPNARFVSLKEIVNDQFIITGPTQSRKGQEIKANNKAALTFWWTRTARQVRIQGEVTFIDGKKAEHYFAQRNSGSKIVSNISEQGQPLLDLTKMHQLLATQKIETKGEISKPAAWGGFALNPSRMELMRFSEDRFHLRYAFWKDGDKWQREMLQP